MVISGVIIRVTPFRALITLLTYNLLAKSSAPSSILIVKAHTPNPYRTLVISLLGAFQRSFFKEPLKRGLHPIN